MGKTIAEKILSMKAGVDAKANDIVVANLDFVCKTVLRLLAIQAFEEMGGNQVLILSG